MKLAHPIRRVETAKGHYYKDGNGVRVPGVTTLIDGGKPKPALINWSANVTAECAINEWDELSEMKPAARLKHLQGARYAEKDKAAKRGTEIHRYGEALIKGESVDVPEELVGHVEAYARFLDSFKVEPVHVEFSVGNYSRGYAGTGDTIADLVIPRVGKKRLLLDLKSNRSGIFGETALQLSAYRYAEVLIPGAGGGEELPMPEVDDCGAVHIRADVADLIPVTTNKAVFHSFLYVAEVAAFDKESRDLIGAPIQPETDSAFRLVRTEK